MGRPQFEQVVAQASKEELITVEERISTALAIGSPDQVYFYAAPNTIGSVKGIRVTVPRPVGSTSGESVLFVIYDMPQTFENVDLAKGHFAFDTDAHINYGMIYAGSEAKIIQQLPQTKEAQAVVLTNIEFDDQVALYLAYRNDTNVIQNGERIYQVTFKQRAISKID